MSHFESLQQFESVSIRETQIQYGQMHHMLLHVLEGFLAGLNPLNQVIRSSAEPFYRTYDLRFIINQQYIVELTYAALFHDAVSLVPEQERADTLQLLSQLSWPAQYRSIPAIAHIFDHITTCVRPCTAGSVLLPWRSALNALAAVYRNEFIINLKVPMKK